MFKFSTRKLKTFLLAFFCIVTAAGNVISYLKNSAPSNITVIRGTDSTYELAAEPVNQALQDETIYVKKDLKETSEDVPAGKDGRININTATSEELRALKGIGPSKASAIIEYRERYGGFTCPEELTEVKGIGEKTFEKLKDSIYAD